MNLESNKTTMTASPKETNKKRHKSFSLECYYQYVFIFGLIQTKD